jgi:HD-like signal output (HDOD) protein
MPVTETEQRTRIRADLERRLDDLPVLPAVAARIASLDPSAGDFTSRVEELARLDPPLTARLLRLCASGLSQPCSVPEAIARVGARPLAETITSLAVMQVFVPTTGGQRNLWIHAIGTALTARCIAQLASTSWQLAPERAYLAGLMHDLGRFIMYDRTPAELGQVDETHWGSPAELVAAEMKVCGFDHAFLGALACERWVFPELVTDMVREHHLYGRERSAARSNDLARLVRVLQAADCVNILVLTRPECVNATDQEKATLLKGLYRGVGWSEGDTPYHAGALAAELRRIDEECKRLAVFLGLAAPEHSANETTE